MRLVAYCRVSGESQKGNTSLPGQRSEIEKYCDSQNYQLIAFTWDVESGESVEKREGFQVALHLVLDDTADGMIVYKQDRFCRKVSDAEALKEEFKRLGKHLLFVADPVDWSTDDGEMMYQFKSVFAEYERKQIRKRCLEGKARKAAAGGYTGGKPPYGWRAGKDGLEVDASEQQAIARIVWWAETGLGFYSIANQMNAERDKHRPRKAQYWSARLVKKILVHERTLVARHNLEGLPNVCSPANPSRTSEGLSTDTPSSEAVTAF